MTFYLRVCHPEHSVQFAHQHNVNVWQCFCSLLGQPLHSTVWEVSSLPFHLGGLGLRSAFRTIHGACWGSWTDCLNTIRQRHANIAQTMVQALDSPPETAIHLVGAAWSRAMLASEGFESPSWHQFLQGLRPQQPAFDEMEPGFFSHGWQFLGKVVEQRFLRSAVVWPRCTPTQQALLRSQSGPMSGFPFSAVPSSSAARFPAQLFRVLLLAVSSTSLAITVQHVVKPAPASPRTSSSAIWTFLWSGRTGAASRLLLMVYLCLMVQNWRSTPRSCHPSEQMGCAQTWMAAALAQARRCKQRTYPELDGHGRARLVVLGAGRRKFVRS